MPFWKKRSRQHQSQPAVAATAPIEQAVLIHITSLTDSDAGLDLVEDPLIEAIERERVGEFDGHEFGPDGAMLYMYGPDADALWNAIEGVVRSSPLGPGSYAVKRYGPPGSSETRVPLP